ncbi:MAG: hypothetical protein IPH94_07580 [Saprospiraceae bacterium]|nr:hypothetical protein [Saprospiraceae bacterium]
MISGQLESRSIMVYINFLFAIISIQMIITKYKKSLFIVFSICLQLGLSACKPSTPMENNVNTVKLNDETQQAKKSSTEAGIKELGLLKSIEDSGYPFFTLYIEFPERGFSEYFSVNLEELQNIDSQDLTNAVGKYVSFEYHSDLINSLIEIEYLDKGILLQDNTVFQNDDLKRITGVLSNAAEETTGDLPGEIYITTEEEITEKFSFFITAELVALNGKVVTAHYEQRTLNTITSLEITE